MVRFVLYAVLLVLIFRAANRLWRGLAEGIGGSAMRTGAATQSVQMVRDPVCGTFVVPGRSYTLTVGRQQVHFCSAACRDAYSSRPS